MNGDSGHEDSRFDMGAGALCLNFVNTTNYRSDPPDREERLRSFEDLVDWWRQAAILSERQAADLLDAAGLQPQNQQPALERARETRTTLFQIFSRGIQGGTPRPSDLAVLNRDLPAALVFLRLDYRDTEFHWSWAFPPTSLIAPLAPIWRSAAELLTSAELGRVRECAAPDCGWLFLDTTRNRSRRWCDMRACGNRDKVRRFRQRQG